MAEFDAANLNLSDFLPYRLSVLNKRSSRLLSSVYQEKWGITVLEWQVMAAIGHFTRVSCQDVGSFSQLDKSAVFRATRSLAASGLIKRVVNPSDRRETLLSFTPKGRRLYNQIVPLAIDWENQLTAPLAEDERKALDRVLTKLDLQLQSMEVKNFN